MFGNFLMAEIKNTPIKINLLFNIKLSISIIQNHLILHLIAHKKENDTLHVFNRFGNQYRKSNKIALFL